MSNELEIIGEDILHAVEYPFVHTAQFVALLGEALTETPAVKNAVIQLVNLGEVVVNDSVADIGTSGLNFVSDEKTVVDVNAFFAYYQSTFLPAVEAAYADIKAAEQAAAPEPAA